MNIYKVILTAGLQIFCCSVLFAKQPPVKVENGWVRAVPSSLSDSAAFMTLVNESDHLLRLTGAHTDIAAMVEPMITTRQTRNGIEIMGMKGVSELDVPAHGRLVLAPGGNHLMIMQLKQHPKSGSEVKLTLEFDSGREEVA
ncbi:MAG TPA: copper chaperone PCu(A)C, partial [Chthoniobacterales bacterium]